MRRLASPGWLLRHAIVVVLVAVFLGLGWWQLGRAEDGNPLSLGYTIEWPFFAAFVIFMWIREMRLALRADHGRSTESVAHPTVDTATADTVATAPVDSAAGVTTFDVGAALARRAGDQRAGVGIDADSDYNHYLAWLAANPGARPRDYPTGREKTRTEISGTQKSRTKKTENVHG
jgi:hypothetical protein